MRRKLVLAFAGGIVTASFVIAFFARGGSAVAQVNGASPAAQYPLGGAQPDTSSSNWKPLSDDVGVMIRNDGNLGLRGRLYVRVKGVWLPVSTDGPGDTQGFVPLR